MLYDDIEDPGETSPDEIRAEYEDELMGVIEDHGIDTVAEESGVDRETVAVLEDGETEGFQLEDAAAILAVDDDAPAKDDILLETRDNLLMGMTTAVLDVDTIAADLDADLDAKQIQQKIEGREPMTLEEYAELQHFIASRQR